MAEHIQVNVISFEFEVVGNLRSIAAEFKRDVVGRRLKVLFTSKLRGTTP